MASSGNMKYAYQFGNFRTGFLIYKAEGIYLKYNIFIASNNLQTYDTASKLINTNFWGKFI